MKKAVILFSLCLLLSGTNVYSLSDSEYEILKENSTEFADADKRLGVAWTEAKDKITENDKKELLSSQRQWIKTGWDKRANQLISEKNMKRTQAYTQAIEERIQFLNSYSPNISKDKNELKTITVEAEGSGITKLDALQAAWMEAVRKAVGIFMTAKTDMINDDVTEKIATYSQGKVNSYNILSENKNNNTYHIVISANIERDILEKTIKGKTVKKHSFDGKNVAAQNLSKKEKVHNLSEVIGELSERVNLESCLAYDSEIIKSDNQFYMIHQLKFELNKFLKEAKSLEKAISNIASQKKVVTLNTKNAKESINVLKMKNNVEDWMFRNGVPANLYSMGKYRSPFEFSPDVQVLEHGGICFIQNISTANCYLFDKGLDNKWQSKFTKKYKVTFSAEMGEGFDSIIAEPYRVTISYPTTIQEAFKQLYIAPRFYVHKAMAGSGGNPAICIIYPQKLRSVGIENIEI